MHKIRQYLSRIQSPALVVAIWLNKDTNDVEYVPIYPLPHSMETIHALREGWAERRLKLVGCMAWNSDGVQTALDPLPADILARLHRGFASFMNSLSTYVIEGGK